MNIGPSVNPDVLKSVNGKHSKGIKFAKLFDKLDGKLDRKTDREEKMPTKSAKQYRFMQMMAHNPDKAKSKRGKGKGIGPSPEVAEEMIKKTPASKRKQFARAKK